MEQGVVERLLPDNEEAEDNGQINPRVRRNLDFSESKAPGSPRDRRGLYMSADVGREERVVVGNAFGAEFRILRIRGEKERRGGLLVERSVNLLDRIADN